MLSLEDLLKDVVRQRNALVSEILTACKSLEPVHRTIIMYRYIEDMGWTDISDRMCYSESHIYELHRKAIREIERVSGG